MLTGKTFEEAIKSQTDLGLRAEAAQLGDEHRKTFNHFYKIEEIERLFLLHILSGDPARKYTVMEIGGQSGLHARHFLGVFGDNIEKFILNDISADVLKNARIRLKDFPNIMDFLVSPAEELDMDRKVDCIYMNASLHHMTDPFKALERIKKALKPKGLLVLSEPMVWNPINLWRGIFINDERKQFTSARKGCVHGYLRSLDLQIVEDRVLHLRTNNGSISRVWPYKKLEKIKILNPLAMVFLYGAIRRNTKV